MLRRFAVELLNDVADECELRGHQSELLAKAAEKITDIVEILSVESDDSPD